MGKRILIFNIVYYTITLLFVNLGREDASSSLGYGFFIIGFWIIAGITLIVLLRKRNLQPKSVLEKIGIFTATPVLSIVAVGLILMLSEQVGSERHFNNGNYRYKVKTINYNTAKVKRVEFYRKGINASAISGNWLRDSTWIFFSEAGDTIKKVHYRDDVEIE